MALKPKIIYFITEDWYFYSHRLPIARAARDAGFEVIVITRVDKHRGLIMNEGFKLIPIALKRRSRNLISELISFIEIIRIYRHEKPDIVHQVAIKPILYGSLAARITGVSSVVNAFAGLGYIFVAEGWKAKLFRKIFSLAFRLVFFSKSVCCIFQNPDDIKLFVEKGIVEKEKTVLIRGSGVDTNRFHLTPEINGQPIVVLASRMLWDKGISEFVDAVRQLKKRGVDLRAVLVGNPDSENPSSISKSILIKWKNDELVEWNGYEDNMPEVFKRSNIVVLPSYREGLPKVLLEAASCGRAIIATDVPGCREIVHHNVNGLLIPPYDSISLANALNELIEDQERRATMGACGREIVEEQFSEKIVVRQTMELYKKLLTNLENKLM